MKFYWDEHVDGAGAFGLRQRGIDVLTVSVAGLRSAPDDAHPARALLENRVIFSQDDDFLRLHANGVQHAGMVYAPQGTSVGTIIRGPILINQILTEEDIHGRVEFLPI